MPSSPVQQQRHSTACKDLRPPTLTPFLAEPSTSTRTASPTLHGTIFQSKQAKPSISTLLNSDISSFSSVQTPPRPHSTPRRLTWVESESIWIVTSPSPGSPTSSSTWGDVNWSAAACRPPPLQHSRSMDMAFTHGQTQPAPDDLPPPYERHYFDRPLPPLPPEAEMDLSVGGSSIHGQSAYSQSTSLDSGHGHGHTRGSRWTEIARRINRSPFG
ncbi:uncharacterized protein CDV56_102384 [Aspergillus thermomutatus]|uniref:Uncharacterized protein n=1 Tax=Aspergillus thermomutatus TaxID=41047 RepID=A0A397HGY0_ASPTH|nr:uncharacterized protein CDV56_102384 [Aspergillus thermomutatus]RHZ59710.1 hypothetical protein CDV56_102384 [Aspergillus thermomutatus]